MPVEAPQADGTKKVIDYDLSIRGDTTLEALAQLKPSFKPDGHITPGNSSPLNADASAMYAEVQEEGQEARSQALG